MANRGVASGAIVHLQWRYLYPKPYNQSTPNYHSPLNVLALLGQSKCHLHFELLSVLPLPFRSPRERELLVPRWPRAWVSSQCLIIVVQRLPRGAEVTKWLPTSFLSYLVLYSAGFKKFLVEATISSRLIHQKLINWRLLHLPTR